MNWPQTTALVTGAGGFIGSHLVEALVRMGARTRAFVHYNARADWGHLSQLDDNVRQRIEVIPGDITDRSRVREALDGCQVVFYLAALIAIPYSYSSVQSYLAANVQGTFNVLEACRECQVRRLVHTSTSEVYGTAQYTPIDERHPLHAQSPYAATKIGADQLAGSYHASFDLPVVIVRPFNNYGPRQSARAVIPTIVSQALASDEIELGSTTPVRDFLYVTDTVRGFLAAGATEGVSGETFNLGTGHGVQIAELVDLVGQALNKPLRIRSSEARQRPEKSEVLELLCSAENASHRLDWRPEVQLVEGLRRTIEWIEKHRQHYRPDQYTV